jgi:hypothetical protein
MVEELKVEIAAAVVRIDEEMLGVVIDDGPCQQLI